MPMGKAAGPWVRCRCRVWGGGGRVRFRYQGVPCIVAKEGRYFGLGARERDLSSFVEAIGIISRDGAVVFWSRLITYLFGSRKLDISMRNKHPTLFDLDLLRGNARDVNSPKPGVNMQKKP